MALPIQINMTCVSVIKVVEELARTQTKKTKGIYVVENDLNRGMKIKLAENAFVMILAEHKG